MMSGLWRVKRGCHRRQVDVLQHTADCTMRRVPLVGAPLAYVIEVTTHAHAQARIRGTCVFSRAFRAWWIYSGRTAM